jgi:hypothetical protein
MSFPQGGHTLTPWLWFGMLNPGSQLLFTLYLEYLKVMVVEAGIPLTMRSSFETTVES